MANIVAEYTNNNIIYKLYHDRLEITKHKPRYLFLSVRTPPIQIMFHELNHDTYESDGSIYTHEFSRYIVDLFDRNSLYNDNKYIITIIDKNDNKRVVLNENISRDFFQNIINVIEPFLIKPGTNYPNNGKRVNRIIPVNTSNAVTYTNINDGANMVNFHGEFDHGRFYTRNTFNKFQPHVYSGKKRNPFTQQNIEPGNITRYKAKKPAAGGRRRKTMKRCVNKKKHTYRRR